MLATMFQYLLCATRCAGGCTDTVLFNSLNNPGGCGGIRRHSTHCFLKRYGNEGSEPLCYLPMTRQKESGFKARFVGKPEPMLISTVHFYF